MKDFERSDLSFPLCGLNCSLCSMKLDGHCPGCGGGAGNQGCPIARCSRDHGDYNYCYECSEYPCVKYNDITKYDSFITHRNQLSDMQKASQIGWSAYRLELSQKEEILYLNSIRYDPNKTLSTLPYISNECIGSVLSSDYTIL